MAVSWWRSKDAPSGLVPDVGLISYATGEPKSMRPESSNSQTHVFYFFAPWCGICQQTANNSYVSMTRHQGVTVTFIALDFDSKAEVKVFVDRHLRDVRSSDIYFGDDSVKAAWSVKAYPTYAFVDRDRNVSSLSVGYVLPFVMWAKLKWMHLGQVQSKMLGHLK